MSTISARQGQMLLRALENLGLDATDIARRAGPTYPLKVVRTRLVATLPSLRTIGGW